MNSKLERFKRGKMVALHTQTEEIAKALMEWCSLNDISWGSGSIASHNTRWEVYRETTCYCNHSGMGYSPVCFFLAKDYEILELTLDDILKEVAPVYEND